MRLVIVVVLVLILVLVPVVGQARSPHGGRVVAGQTSTGEVRRPRAASPTAVFSPFSLGTGYMGQNEPPLHRARAGTRRESSVLRWENIKVGGGDNDSVLKYTYVFNLFLLPKYLAIYIP